MRGVECADCCFMGQRLLTHAQASEHLGVSVGTVRALLRDGILSDLRVGPQHRVSATQIEQLRAAFARLGGQEKRLLRSSEAAKILGVSQSTIENWSIAGRLPFTSTVGGHRRYQEEDVRRLQSDGFLARTD